MTRTNDEVNVTMTFVYGRFLRNRANSRDKVKVPLEKNKEGERKGESYLASPIRTCVIYIALHIYIYIHIPKSKHIDWDFQIIFIRYKSASIYQLKRFALMYLRNAGAAFVLASSLNNEKPSTRIS